MRTLGRSSSLITMGLGHCRSEDRGHRRLRPRHDLVGRLGEPSELLQLFLPPGTTKSTPRPEIGAAETLAATTWWVERLTHFSARSWTRRILSTTGNLPAQTPIRSAAQHRAARPPPREHPRNDRDLPTRRLLGFSVLDMLEGLGLVSFEDACRLTRVSARWRRSNSRFRAPRRRCCCRTCAVRRGAARNPAGFLPVRVHRRGWHSGAESARRRAHSRLSDAVALYLRVLRNVNHGFSGRNETERRRDEILLMAHDGELPDGVAFLAYLYGLRRLPTFPPSPTAPTPAMTASLRLRPGATDDQSRPSVLGALKGRGVVGRLRRSRGIWTAKAKAYPFCDGSGRTGSGNRGSGECSRRPPSRVESAYSRLGECREPRWSSWIIAGERP